MRKCTSSFPKWIVARRKICVIALVALTVLSVYTIFYRPYQSEPPFILIVNRPNGTSVGPTCRNDVRWVNFSSHLFRLYVYSAFYDDRPSLMSDPVIRIIAVSDPFERLIALNADRLYCILHHASNTIALLMIEDPEPIGHGWDLNKRKAIEYVYTCPSMKGMIPYAVSISASPALGVNSPKCIPVTLPNKPKKLRAVCVCPQAAYGLSLDPHKLIEWMEIQKILGVSLVGIHVLSASESVLNVLKHYAAEGFVDLREMHYIYSSVYGTDEEFWLHLTPAINDCIYRHMYEFRRIAVMDFDEIIMPRYHENLSELLTYLDKKNAKKKTRSANYCFRNNYFFLDLPPDNTISPHLSFLRFREKAPVSPRGYSVKSIIDPQACTHMHNHYCWGLTARYFHYNNTVSVDPEIALNQHYKKCHFSRETCDDMLENSIRDDVMLRLRDILIRNVRTKVKAITGKEV